MIIVGQQVKTKAVPHGQTKVIACRRCGRPVDHAEHRVVHTATLFFLPVANVVEQTVWCCAGCGTRVAEGDSRWLSGDQGGTAVGNVMAAVGSVAEEAGPALRRFQRGVTAAVDAVFTDEPAPSETPDAPPRTKTPPPASRKRRL
ncbi:MAG: hypothetical protein AAF211_06205 [Myxococcota bacterium]